MTCSSSESDNLRFLLVCTLTIVCESKAGKKIQNVIYIFIFNIPACFVFFFRVFSMARALHHVVRKIAPIHNLSFTIFLFQKPKTLDTE